MLRAYPRRACVHASLAFLTWSVVAAIVPSLTSVCFLGLAGLSLALGFLLIERVVRPREPALCARLGVIDVGYSPVVRGWALAVFGLAVEPGDRRGGRGDELDDAAVKVRSRWRSPATDWWAMLATLGLTGIFLMTLGGDAEGWGALGAGAPGGRASLGGRGSALVAGGRLLAAGGPGGWRGRLLSAGHRGGRPGDGPDRQAPYPRRKLARAGLAG